MPYLVVDGVFLDSGQQHAWMTDLKIILIVIPNVVIGDPVVLSPFIEKLRVIMNADFVRYFVTAHGVRDEAP